jgi:Zn-dependent protease
MRSFKIGSAFGIGIFIHWTFFLLPAWVVLTNLEASAEQLGLHLAVLLAAFGCVVLHELGHALTARQFGIPTRDITLYPIGGVARLERMPEKPMEEILIALAGPAVNVVIAGVLLGILVIPFSIDPRILMDTFGGQFLLMLLLVNVGLVVFNLLPAFPMDGGRVFRAILAWPLGQLRATQIAVGLGVVMALAIGVGLQFLMPSPSPWLIAIAFFVFLAGQQELEAVRYRHEMRMDEPLEVIPVRRRREPVPTPIPLLSLPLNGVPAPRPQPTPPLPVLWLQPRIVVERWDAERGIWVREPGT